MSNGAVVITVVAMLCLTTIILFLIAAAKGRSLEMDRESRVGEKPEERKGI